MSGEIFVIIGTALFVCIFMIIINGRIEKNGRNIIQTLNEHISTHNLCSRAMKAYGIQSNFSNLHFYLRYNLQCCLLDHKYGNVYHLRDHEERLRYSKQFYLELQFKDTDNITVVSSKYFVFHLLENDVLGENSVCYFFESYRYRLMHYLTSDSWDKKHFSLLPLHK